jgi:dipeptidyl aminopeptidase/acylaminoacyl peptidase
MKSILFSLLLLLFVTNSFVFSQALSVKQIMAEPSIAGMRAESEKLSPDGQKVIFSWNAEGKEPRNLYIWTGGEPNILVNAEQNYEQKEEKPESKLNYGLLVRDDFVKSREKNLFGVEFSPDSKRILFLQNSDIYVLDLGTKDVKPRRITRTQGSENSARWLTNESILYSSNGNYFVLNLKETSIIQVTKEANPAAFIGIGNLATSKDGKLLAYVVSDTSKQRALFVPNYLDEFTTAPTFRRGWSEQKIMVSPTDGSREKPFEINLPKAEGVSFFRVVKWSADNRSLIVDRNDKDTKRRQLFYIIDVGSKAEQIILVTDETDEKWIAPLSAIIEPNPNDDSQILFTSEKDGFNHLYLATLEQRKSEPNPNGVIRQENPTDSGFSGKVDIQQLTSGKFEVDWAKWREKTNEIVFSSTEKSTAGRDFFTYNLDDGKKTNVPSSENGIKNEAQIANPNDSTFILFKGSKWNKPTELFIQRVCNECNGLYFPIKITKTTPESFLDTKWNEPKFVDIPTKDGKFIKSKVYLPSNFGENSAKRIYPMVIFVHGAGYLQNTINGWNNYYREFMFNQMLTQKGYVVLDIDFRGSAGYGRDWRTDVYDFLGDKDYEDHLDAIDYAVKNYAVNPKKIGVYGGSYGGFMAEMLAFRTDKITCAAALRPVSDWKNYYASSPVYTAQRLGFPDKNVEGYKRSSPITYAEKLDKPLLILHGLVDDNVHAQDSIQLIEKLIRLEKTNYFEAMLYPVENHGFTRPTSWKDEYERIFVFFEKYLK